jgi:hypothetical protein
MLCDTVQTKYTSMHKLYIIKYTFLSLAIMKNVSVTNHVPMTLGSMYWALDILTARIIA